MRRMTLREAGLLVKLVPYRQRPVAVGILLPHIPKPKATWLDTPTIQDWVEWATSRGNKRR